MASPETSAKLRLIFAETDNVLAKLDTSPASDAISVVRKFLLCNCLEIRGIIARGTTHTSAIPARDVLRQAQLLLLAFRQQRETGRKSCTKKSRAAVKERSSIHGG